MSTETLEKPPVELTIVGESEGLNSFEAAVKKSLKEQEEKSAPKPTETKDEKTAVGAKGMEEAVHDADEVTENPLLKAFKGIKKEEVKAEEEPKKEPEKVEVNTPTDKEVNLANLRKKAQSAEAERDALKAELKKAKETYPEDYRTLKEEHALMEAELKKHSLASTPGFKKKYDEKLGFSKKNLQNILKNTEVSAEDFLKIVESPDSKERRQQIAELVGGMDDYSKNAALAQIASFDSVRMEREAELANPDEQLIQLTERQKQEQQQRVAQAEGVIDEVWAQAEKDIPWLNLGEDTPDEMKQEVAQMRALATSAWKGADMSPQGRAALVVAGAAYPVLNKIIGALNEQLTAKDAVIARLRGSTPNAGAQRTVKEQEKPMSFTERVASELEKSKK